jgi:hypothetical protein
MTEIPNGHVRNETNTGWNYRGNGDQMIRSHTLHDGWIMLLHKNSVLTQHS